MAVDDWMAGEEVNSKCGFRNFLFLFPGERPLTTPAVAEFNRQDRQISSG